MVGPNKSLVAALVPSTTSTRESVQDYYGKALQTSDDLVTNACCTARKPPPHIRELLKNIHPTTLTRYYGCGLCLPNYDLTDCSVLDLGCGAGRDVYLASQLVGAGGRVVGVDMTTEQLEAARCVQSHHADKFGYDNTEFYQGYLESLHEIPELKPESFDLIISNCVMNLCTDKAAVLKSCYSLLKPGGELYFSDVYSNRRVPQVLQDNKLLWGECLSGALYWNDFMSLSKEAGFKDPRLVEDSPITIRNKEVSEMIENAGHGAIEFYSATYRLMKIANLDDHCEDYGQAVVYKGTIPRSPGGWKLDKHHLIETGRMFPVCGNTYRMLYDSPRLRPNFDFFGTWERHYGLFDGCAGAGFPFDQAETCSVGTGTSCCNKK